jgi:hypothetical protein
MKRSGEADNIATLVYHQSLMRKIWRAICEVNVPMTSQCTVMDQLRGKETKIMNLPDITVCRGTAVWFEVANMLKTEFLDEYISVESTFQKDFSDLEEQLADRPLMCYSQREYLQWVSPEVKKKRRGRPPIYTRALTAAERQKRHYYRRKSLGGEEAEAESSAPVERDQADEMMEAGEGPSRKKKLKRTDVDAQESDVQHQLAYLPLVYPRSTSTYVPTDTSLAIVKPSSICNGLGVYAAVAISKGTTITSYTGITTMFGDREDKLRDWQKTHLKSLSKGTNAVVLDGIRYPQGGQGVLSLVNSYRGTGRRANVRLKSVPSPLPNPFVHLVADRDIEPDEELLADYNVL